VYVGEHIYTVEREREFEEKKYDEPRQVVIPYLSLRQQVRLGLRFVPRIEL